MTDKACTALGKALAVLFKASQYAANNPNLIDSVSKKPFTLLGKMHIQLANERRLTADTTNKVADILDGIPLDEFSDELTVGQGSLIWLAFDAAQTKKD